MQIKALEIQRSMDNPRLTEGLGDLGADIDLEEKYQGRGNQGGADRGRGKGGRGGKAGGGGGNPQNKAVQVSKALSKLLRHAAADAGVKLDSEGYARLDEVVSRPIFLYKEVEENVLSAQHLLPPRDIHMTSSFFLAPQSAFLFTNIEIDEMESIKVPPRYLCRHPNCRL